MEKTNKMNPVSFLIPGCLFIGMGIGFIFNAIPIGLLIGLGTGLLLTGFLVMYQKKESNDGKTI
jgi:hypothetical protein